LLAMLMSGCGSGSSSGGGSSSGSSSSPSAGTGGSGGGAAQKQWKKDLVLGAGALGGNHYNTGAAVGDLLTRVVDGIDRVSVMSGANISFPPMLQEGRVDVALATPDILYYAYSPEEGQGFSANITLDKIRVMGAFFINIMDLI